MSSTTGFAAGDTRKDIRKDIMSVFTIDDENDIAVVASL